MQTHARISILLLACVVAAAIATPAAAGNYIGYGETGFSFSRKRDCCDAALEAAGRDSARACESAGGWADYDPRRLRGQCDTDWRQSSDGSVWYGCTAKTSVRCR